MPLLQHRFTDSYGYWEKPCSPSNYQLNLPASTEPGIQSVIADNSEGYHQSAAGNDAELFWGDSLERYFLKYHIAKLYELAKCVFWNSHSIHMEALLLL